MKSFDTIFDEVKIIEPNIFNDKRGFFFESYNSKNFQKMLKSQNLN